MKTTNKVLKIGRWGKGIVTTDLHGDIVTFRAVEKIFRKDPSYHWWLDLGDKVDSEKNKMIKSKIPISGDIRIYDRIYTILKDIRNKKLSKNFLEIKGNHDERNLELWDIFEKHDLFKKRKNRSLASLLQEVARKENWLKNKREKLKTLISNYPDWIEQLKLEIPGLSRIRAAYKFLIEKVYCQHGFVMRMRKKDQEHMSQVSPLVAYFSVSKILAAHGGICHAVQKLEDIDSLTADQESEFYWNRYGSNYWKEELESFLEGTKSSCMIVGHTPILDVLEMDPVNSVYSKGVAISCDKLLTFTSSYGSESGVRVFLEIDSSKVYTHPNQIVIHRIVV